MGKEFDGFQEGPKAKIHPDSRRATLLENARTL